MVLNTEWAQVEVIDLINDGSGLAFGIIGGRSTGVVVKTILPGGVADRDGRLQSGDHILQIGEVNLRGLGSEQVASVLRQCGVHVRMVVARPVESGSSEYQGISSHAPIVPTKILGDPVELDRHLIENGYAETFAAPHPSNNTFGNATTTTPFIYSGQQTDLMQMHPISGIVDVVRDPKPIGPVTISNLQQQPQQLISAIPVDVTLKDPNLPETECYTVTLRKDDLGLGITVAGYVCEKEEISGIFVKSISKGSAADLTGRIKVNDRIVEVDGRSIIGQSNHQAVECLRNTDATVTIRFERYLRGPKFEQLQQAIRANELKQPTTPPSPSSVSTLPKIPFSQVQMSSLTIEPELESRTSFDFDSAVLLESMTPTNENQEIVIGGGPAIEQLSHEAVYEKWKALLPEDAEIVMAQLEKGTDSGLGISLEGTVDVEDGQEVRPHHYIRNILPDGPVGRNGVLRSGDELLEVNGIRLMGLNHLEVVSTLKQLPSAVRIICSRTPIVTRIIDTAQHKEAFKARNILADSLQTIICNNRDQLVKAKSETSLASSALSDMCSAPCSSRSRSLDLVAGFPMWSDEPVVVELIKADHGLGFSILDYQDPMNPQETVIVIRSLVPGGVAQTDGRLIPGDRVIAVNGIDIEHATLDRAVKVLKGVSKGTVTITVVKPLSTNDSAMHNSQDTDQDEQTCLDEFQECLEEYQECLEVVQICLDGDNAFELSIDDDDDDELIRSSSINNNNNNQHNQEQHHNKNNNNNSSSNNNNNNLTSNNSKVTVNNNNKLVSESEPELSYKSVCDEEEEAVVVEDVEKRVNCTTENCKLDPASSTSLLIKKCQNNSNSNSCSSSGGVGSFVVKTKQTDSVAVETGQKLPNEEPSSDKTDGYETCIDESFSEDAVCAKIKLQNDDDDKADDDQIGETRGDVEEDRFDGDANKTPTNSAEDLLGDRFPANVASTDLDERGAEQPSTTDAIVRLTSADEDDYLKCYDDRADDIGEDDDNQDVSLDTDEFFLIDYDRTRSRSSKSDVVSIKSSSEPNVHRPFFYRKRLDEYYNDYADCLDSYIVDARDNVVDGGGETECERVVARVKDGASLTGGKSSGTRLNGKSSSAPDILDKSFVMLTYDPGPQKNLRRRRSALDPTFTATNCVEMMRESLPMTVSKKEPNRRSLADARETDVDNMLQKHWGSIRTVRIFKEPNTSLGISIVGGKVDLYNSSSPGTETILGIFVKNVVPDSPAGRTGQLKTGDRILEVSGVQLRNASHERAVEAIRNAPNPVTFLVQSLIPWSIDNNNEHETSASSRYANNNCSSPYPSPVSFGANEQCGPATSGDRKDSRKGKKLTHRQGETIVEGRENVDLARLQGTCCNDLDTVTRFDDGGGVDEGRDSNKKITTSNTSILPNDDNINKITASSTRITATATTAATTTTKSIESSEESDDDEEDVRELEGRTVSAKGHEIDRASAANIKRTKEEISADPEEEDDFGYTINKVKKKYANLGHTILMVQLERSGQGLGLSLAGHKDRNCMAVFVCGLNPMGVAFKTGGIQVGDEILEVNGVVLHGRCHLNASAIIKGLSGPIFKVIILRRKTAIDDIAVKPITQFPVSLAEETSEEAFSNYPNVRTVSIKKGTQSLGIMIIEGKHAEVGQGIFISDLQEGSAAEKAGLEIGEMILAVNKDSLLGSNYDNAANLLKRTEGLVRLVVSNPGKKPGTPTAGDEKIGLKAAGPPTRPTTPVPEPPADPATCPIKSGKETTIEINSDNKPLGVFFVGGKDTQTTGGIVVVEVHGNGMAEKDNRLQSGDQILDVNGTTLKDVTYNGALQALRQTLPKMKLIVYRPEKIDYQDIDVEFVKKPGKGLGLSVVGRKAGKGVYVGDVLNGGPADIDGKISRGDLIVSVNGQSIENATAEEAAAVLKTATGKVAIKLHRYKPAAR